MAGIALFFSCKNEISITADNADGYTIEKCTLELGKALTQTLSDLTQYNDVNIEETFFSEKEIKRLCDDSSFTDNFVYRSENSLSVKVSPEILQQTYLLLSDEEKSYMDLLMAPSITGEKMSLEEYSDLVASVYGQELADELYEGRLYLNLGCPSGKKIKKALASGQELSWHGARALFEIPLIFLLCNQEEAEYSIFW